MKLYVGPLSLFSAKSRIALAEKGVEAELVFVGWSREARYEPHHPDVVALNPKRQVPVLVDGDVCVYDSTLIGEYLEERVPDPPLFPATLEERARCRRLEAEGDEVWFPFVWNLIEQRFYPDDEQDEDLLARTEAGLVGLYEGLEKELLSREFLNGGFSVADVSLFIQLHTASVLGVRVPERCIAVHEWYKRVSQRPSVVPVLADMTRAAAAAMAS